ncbi:hypothetical protein TSUD_139690 [Trifolium subterraneum]|uniref:Uncharacterized protein n=1 Tax=Trifolium subterraneum TaxID=3900 RepID=A0A2Z6NWA3_TRISU|nr:hypothetical protein TSUD_139690 [Trifolium subterraneum]
MLTTAAAALATSVAGHPLSLSQSHSFIITSSLSLSIAVFGGGFCDDDLGGFGGCCYYSDGIVVGGGLMKMKLDGGGWSNSGWGV